MGSVQKVGVAGAIAFILAGVSTVPASAAQILVNPGFESGSLAPGWFQARDFSGGEGSPWTVDNAFSPPSGTYSAVDSGNRELKQVFAGVSAATITEVSFWIRRPFTFGPTPFAYDFFYSDNTDDEFIGHTTNSNWDFENVTANLDTSKTLVAFSLWGINTGGQSPDMTRYDDVKIIGTRGVTQGGGVPEPDVWSLMLLGFGSLGSALRRRRALTA